MRQFTKNVTFEFCVEELAEAFCELDAKQQAEFFHEVNEIGRQWGGSDQWTQWRLVADYLRIDPEALAIVKAMGGGSDD